MLEIDCSVLTPHEVLKTSGHVDKFADWMCKDPKNGEIIRADHFVEEILEGRLKGDKEARGQKVEEKEAGEIGAGVDEGPRYWGTGQGKLELQAAGIQSAW